MKEIIITRKDKGKRLDKFLVSVLVGFSRNKIQNAIKKGWILVNNEISRSGYILKEQDKVQVLPFSGRQKRTFEFTYPLEIIYEDEDIMVINKPEGITTHPPHSGYQKSIVAALINAGKILYESDCLRPGVVHRLDKETSGVMVLAKNAFSYHNLVAQFKSRKVDKEYRAIVHGSLKEKKLTLLLPLKRDRRNPLRMKVGFLRAKEAVTHIEVLRELSGYTYLKIKIATGRMHQIRVHLNFVGHPVLGDKKYGIKDEISHLFLHAYRLRLMHPSSGKPLEFIASLPEYFHELLYTTKDA